MFMAESPSILSFDLVMVSDMGVLCVLNIIDWNEQGWEKYLRCSGLSWKHTCRSATAGTSVSKRKKIQPCAAAMKNIYKRHCLVQRLPATTACDLHVLRSPSKTSVGFIGPDAFTVLPVPVILRQNCQRSSAYLYLVPGT